MENQIEHLKFEHIKYLEERLAKVKACHCKHVGGPACCCQPNETELSGRVFGGPGLSQTASLGSVPAAISNGTIHAPLLKDDPQLYRRRVSFNHDSSSVGSNGYSVEGYYRQNDNRPMRINLLKSVSMERHVCHEARNGYLLLINNVHFWHTLQPRNGAEQDEQDVQRFFKRAGFTVNAHYNKTRDEMHGIFNSLTADSTLAQYDTFVVVIMSHGNENGILGVDHLPYSVDDIVDSCKGDHCKVLVGKPKLFFIQACRGNSRDEGVYYARGNGGLQADGIVDMPQGSDDHHVRIPTDADILIAFSTTAGRISVGQVTDTPHNPMQATGSWFISTMVQIFETFSTEEDLMSMMTRVNLALSEYGDELGLKQVPCQVNMLTKKVQFIMKR